MNKNYVIVVMLLVMPGIVFLLWKAGKHITYVLKHRVLMYRAEEELFLAEQARGVRHTQQVENFLRHNARLHAQARAQQAQAQQAGQALPARPVPLPPPPAPVQRPEPVHQHSRT